MEKPSLDRTYAWLLVTRTPSTQLQPHEITRRRYPGCSVSASCSAAVELYIKARTLLEVTVSHQLSPNLPNLDKNLAARDCSLISWTSLPVQAGWFVGSCKQFLPVSNKHSLLSSHKGKYDSIKYAVIIDERSLPIRSNDTVGKVNRQQPLRRQASTLQENTVGERYIYTFSRNMGCVIFTIEDI
jgi:hypothetical protein